MSLHVDYNNNNQIQINIKNCNTNELNSTHSYKRIANNSGTASNIILKKNLIISFIKF